MTHDEAMCYVLGDSPHPTPALKPGAPMASRRSMTRPVNAGVLPEIPPVPESVSDAAYHEAAHAVVALTMGLPVDYVTIDQSPKHDNCAVCVCPVPFHAWTIEQAIMITSAGPASYLMVDSPLHCDLAAQAQANRFDRARVRHLLAAERFAHPASDVVTKAMAEWQARADALVLRDWEWIERVAKRLEARRRVSVDEVERLHHSPEAAR